MSKTYLYCNDRGCDEVSVGRKAVKMHPRRPEKIMATMVEITPTSVDDTWTKWVNELELFEVTG